MTSKQSILFVYWGRRGLTRFTHELAMAANAHPDLHCVLSLSRQNEDFEGFSVAGFDLVPIDTFIHGSGALFQAWRIPFIAKAIRQTIKQRRIGIVVTLMPHVWSPLIMALLSDCPIRHYAIIHDANPHPGDRTGMAHRLMLQTGKQADGIITLSQSVTSELQKRPDFVDKSFTTLFHPVTPIDGAKVCPHQMGEPWKLLFLGRIQAYKGLGLLLDSIQLLREQGKPVELTVMGEGSLSREQNQLDALQVNIINRWLTDQDIALALSTHHAVILSHIEASQSGIAALALGNGMPVVATPVGGLTEQVFDGQTGLIARDVTAISLAETISNLFQNEGLSEAINQGIDHHKSKLSFKRFVDRLLESICKDQPI